ncbi:MAG: dihydrodipicolinate synthase family protein [Sneathiellaceae bacterium]
MTDLRGLSAFPITPSDRDGRVDTEAVRRLVARLRDAGVDSIGLLGSTGTYAYLTRDERRRALEAAVDEAAGRTPVLVGIGALRTDDAVDLARDARAAGVAAGLLAPVSYTPLTDDEVFQHFETVAHESALPICIYDNPGTTHFRFTPGLVARLSAVPGIVAVKSPAGTSSETAGHLAELRGQVPEGFSLGYAADWNATEALIAGGAAWYSVLGGILPGICLRIVRAAQQGDAAEARRLDAALAPVWDLFRAHSSLRTVYVLADLLDIVRADPPRPILPLGDAARHEIAETYRALPAEVTG